MADKCRYSSDIIGKAKLREILCLDSEAKLRPGAEVRCLCGKTVKLRRPPNGSRLFMQVPRHNQP